jgi:hypothetical protein
MVCVQADGHRRRFCRHRRYRRKSSFQTQIRGDGGANGGNSVSAHAQTIATTQGRE